jgi:hypothetical protein
MSRSKSRDLGAGVLTRYRNGACTFTCRHDGCRAYWEPRSWRAGLRQARAHAADHDATEARYAGTPWGIPSGELLPRTTRRRRPLRRLAAAGVVLVLAAVAFVATVVGVASRAAPAPTPSIGIVTTTTTTTTTAPSSRAAGPATTGYRPTAAGPPATNAQGQGIPEPDPPPSTTSSAGGGR